MQILIRLDMECFKCSIQEHLVSHDATQEKTKTKLSNRIAHVTLSSKPYNPMFNVCSQVCKQGSI